MNELARKRITMPCFAVLIVMLTAGCFERLLRRSLICTNGHVHFWVGDVRSPELSQQMTDAYSFSHIIHGFAFYGLFYLLGRQGKWSIGWRLFFTVLVEAGWEMLEKSPIIINRYRQTAAQGYVGDSVLNSMCDIGCCVLGFFLAKWLPVWVVGLAIVGMEVGVGWAVRDNLTLNIIMLIHPFAGIRRWQMGG